MNKKTIILSFVSLASCVVSASANTTIDPAHHNAYGANTGWIEARGDVTHGAVIGHSYCTGYIYSANCGWISLGNTPINGWHYDNAAADDWGVNHDGLGNLTGYAYGANIGWINFEQTHGQPRIDLLTGNLDGHIWSANTGWISLNNAEAYVRTETLSPGPDSDGDGIPDAWEYRQVGDLTTLSGSGHDEDQDGVPDADEYPADTDPDDDTAFFRITALNPAGADTNEVVWTSELTRFYELESNIDLTDASGWADSGFGLISPDAGAITARTVAKSGATNRFYRVKAVLPLAP